MHVSYGAIAVGILGLVYGLTADRFTRRQRAIGAFVLLAAAVSLIIVPYLMGVPW